MIINTKLYLFHFQKIAVVIHFSRKIHHRDLLADISDLILDRWRRRRRTRRSSLWRVITLGSPTVLIRTKCSMATLSLIWLVARCLRIWQCGRWTRRKWRLADRRLLPKDFCSTVLKGLWQIIQRRRKLNRDMFEFYKKVKTCAGLSAKRAWIAAAASRLTSADFCSHDQPTNFDITKRVSEQFVRALLSR